MAYLCKFKQKRKLVESYLTTLQSLQVTWSWNISRHSTHSISCRGTYEATKQEENITVNWALHLHLSPTKVFTLLQSFAYFCHITTKNLNKHAIVRWKQNGICFSKQTGQGESGGNGLGYKTIWALLQSVDGRTILFVAMVNRSCHKSGFYERVARRKVMKVLVPS